MSQLSKYLLLFFSFHVTKAPIHTSSAAGERELPKNAAFKPSEDARVIIKSALGGVDYALSASSIQFGGQVEIFTLDGHLPIEKSWIIEGGHRDTCVIKHRKGVFILSKVEERYDMSFHFRRAVRIASPGNGNELSIIGHDDRSTAADWYFLCNNNDVDWTRIAEPELRETNSYLPELLPWITSEHYGITTDSLFLQVGAAGQHKIYALHLRNLHQLVRVRQVLVSEFKLEEQEIKDITGAQLMLPGSNRPLKAVASSSSEEAAYTVRSSIYYCGIPELGRFGNVPASVDLPQTSPPTATPENRARNIPDRVLAGFSKKVPGENKTRTRPLAERFNIGAALRYEGLDRSRVNAFGMIETSGNFKKQFSAAISVGAGLFNKRISVGYAVDNKCAHGLAFNFKLVKLAGADFALDIKFKNGVKKFKCAGIRIMYGCVGVVAYI